MRYVYKIRSLYYEKIIIIINYRKPDFDNPVKISIPVYIKTSNWVVCVTVYDDTAIVFFFIDY